MPNPPPAPTSQVIGREGVAQVAGEPVPGRGSLLRFFCSLRSLDRHYSSEGVVRMEEGKHQLW